MTNLVRWAGALALACIVVLPVQAQRQPGHRPFENWAGPAAPAAFGDDDGVLVTVSKATPLPSDTVIHSSSVSRSAIVGTAAMTLIPANPARRYYLIQVQPSSGGDCYINGLAAATADYNSLLITSGSTYESSPVHVGTGAISIVCTTAATSVYAREG